MEKFIKENWFKVAALILVIFAGVIFYNRYTIYLDNLKYQESQISCSKNALTWYKNQTGENSVTISSGYENHFNRKLSKCFATVSNSINSGKDYLVSFFIYDVYENHLLLDKHTWLSKSSEDQYIKDDAFGGGTKITKEEFDNLFKLYMESLN